MLPGRQVETGTRNTPAARGVDGEDEKCRLRNRPDVIQQKRWITPPGSSGGRVASACAAILYGRIGRKGTRRYPAESRVYTDPIMKSSATNANRFTSAIAVRRRDLRICCWPSSRVEVVHCNACGVSVGVDELVGHMCNGCGQRSRGVWHAVVASRHSSPVSQVWRGGGPGRDSALQVPLRNVWTHPRD
jgi:hypothetical protein